MKTTRITAFVLAMLMLLSCFVACGEPKDSETTEAPETTAAPETDERQGETDTVPTDLKFPGETATFFVRAGGLYEYELACEELMNDTVYDAIHYRNIDVENRLGISVKTVAQNCTYPGTEWNQTLSTSVLTNTGDYDATAFYMSTGSPLAKDGIFYNLNNLTQEFGSGYFNFEKPWWNQTAVDELTIFGTLFFTSGDLTITQIADCFAITFNKDLFDEKFPEESHNNLYQIVRDGNWTVGTMTDYVSQVWDDTNSSGIIDDGDVVGFRSACTHGGSGWDGWIYAMGLDLTVKDDYGTPEISLSRDPNLMPAFEACRKLHSGNPGSLFIEGTPSGDRLTTITNGNQLFAEYRFKDGASYRDSNINFGVLPLPKYDEDQENYRTTFVNTASALAICSNVSDERASMLSALLEVMSAESYKQVTPAYYGTVLQGQYSKDQADAEMYDLIIKSIVFSFGYAYSTLSLDTIGNIFRNMSPTYDLQATVDSKREAWDKRLEDLLTALEDVA